MRTAAWCASVRPICHERRNQMLAYKAFRSRLVCLGFQFAMGLNEIEKANCAQNGFHCAANPLDCLTYYPDMEKSEYYLVDAGGDLDEDAVDSKISCTKLTILQKLDCKNFFLHALAYMVDHPKREWNRRVDNDSAQAANGFAIVRGADPLASGQLGDILALAKEDPAAGSILQIALTQVDGEKILPGRWYDIDLTERGGYEKKRTA